MESWKLTSPKGIEYEIVDNTTELSMIYDDSVLQIKNTVINEVVGLIAVKRIKKKPRHDNKARKPKIH